MTWKSWFTWSIATVLVLLYVSAGSVASQIDEIGVRLEPGYSTQLHVFRLAEDVLRMRLKFKVGDKPRPELGNHAFREDWRKTGLLKLINPGSAIRIAASMPDAAPVTYEAMPNSVVFPPSSASRDLTPGISISPGVWQWPPTKNGLVLHRGINVVNSKSSSPNDRSKEKTSNSGSCPHLASKAACLTLRGSGFGTCGRSS
jgi:hypothetical protein